MNKSSHLRITGEVLANYTELSKKQRLLVMAGCILPDILIHTYIKSHTWSGRSGEVFEKIRAYKNRHSRHDHDYLQYGCVLHYIEDFFTWPHNASYEGTLKDHVKYETRLHQYLSEKQGKPQKGSYIHAGNAEQLIAQLKDLHQEYMETETGMMTDHCYITKAASMTAEYLLVTMKEKQYYIPLYEKPDYQVYGHVYNISRM